MVFCVSDVIDGLIGNKVDESSDLSEESKKVLDKIGDHSVTLLAVTTGPAAFIAANKDAKKHTDLKTEDANLGWIKTGDGFGDWKQGRVRKIRHKVSDKFSTVILDEDDFFTRYTFMEKLSGRARRNRLLFSLEDSAVYFDSDEQSEALMKDLKLVEGQAMPETYNTDFTMDTDESFARIFFNGMGATLLAKQEKVSEDSELGPFVVDMPLQGLEARSLYKPYGARVHFGEDQKVTAIYDYVEERLVKPGEEHWEETKMQAKVTAFTLLTVREHLVWTHLIASNDATREKTIHLPPSHPIRRLLAVFTYRATEVNVEAFDSLVPNTSLLHRSVALTYKAMEKVFDMSYTESIAYQPFPERVEKLNPALKKLADEGKFPYATDGLAYFEVVKAFVGEWLDKAGDAALDKQATAFYDAMRESSKGQKYIIPPLDDDSGIEKMANLLSTVIFAVTAYHELIGHVVDYTVTPRRAGFRIAKDGDQTQIDMQSFLNAAIISASTSKRMPQLMGEFTNYIGAGGAPSWERDVWDSFQEKLKERSEKVREEDEGRDVEFKYFDPAMFECSVSV